MKLLTLREVAEAMKVSESTVRRWIRAGALTASGTLVIVPPQTATRWCNRQHYRFWSCHSRFES